MTFEEWWAGFHGNVEPGAHAFAKLAWEKSRQEYVGESVPVPKATLKKWRDAIEPFWFSSDGEGDERNNDGVIEVSGEIDALLKEPT